MGEVGVGTYFSVVSLMTGKRGIFLFLWACFCQNSKGGSWWCYDLAVESFMVFFFVHSFYNSFLKATSVSFPCQSIWCVKIPKRLSFFLWTTTRGGILTIDNLVKKNLPLVNWFCLCPCDKETMDYLLLCCSFAYSLWSEVFLLFGV